MGTAASYLPTQIRRLTRVVRAERRVADATAAALADLAQVVATQLAADGYTAVVVDNRAPEWRAALADAIMPVIRDVYDEGFYSETRRASLTAAAETASERPDDRSPADRYAGRYLDEVHNRLTGVADDVFSRITTALEDGRQAQFQVTMNGVTTTETGESIQQLGARVNDLLGNEVWAKRGMVVARTEVISANNAGAHAAARDNAALFGATEGSVIKEWLATSDTRTREAHRDVNHQTVMGLGAAFQVGGTMMQQPGDPAGGAANCVNCRCTALYHYPGDFGYDEMAAELGAISTPTSLPQAPAIEEAYVTELHQKLADGTYSRSSIEKAMETATPLGKANAEAALKRYDQTLAAKAAPVKPTPLPTPQAQTITRTPGSVAAAHAPSPSILEALQPQRSYNAIQVQGPGGRTNTTRAKTLTALAGDPKATQLKKTIDSFQSGSSTAIPRMRTDIEKYLTGQELPPGRVDSIENLLGAIGNSDAGDQALWRGMAVPGNLEDVLARYVPGTDMDLSLASFSSDKKLAQSFTEGGAGQKVKGAVKTPVLIEWAGAGKRALPIQNFAKSSIFWNEKEWVGAGRYQVTGTKTVKRNGVQTVVVTIEQRSPW